MSADHRRWTLLTPLLGLVLSCASRTGKLDPPVEEVQRDAIVELLCPVLTLSEPDAEGALSGEIACGELDGLLPGGRGVLYARPGDERGDGTFELGMAQVEAIGAETATVTLNVSGDAPARVGDLAELPVFIHPRATPSVLFDLGLRHVLFTDTDGQLLLSYRDMEDTWPGDLDAAAAPVFAEYVRDNAWLAEQVEGGETPIGLGRYPDVSLAQAMKKTDASDVMGFLRFVDAYPGRYLGHEWDFLEVYATWVVNGGPTSPEEIRLATLETTDPAERRGFLEAVLDWVGDDAAFFAGVWYSQAVGWSVEGRREEARATLALLVEWSELMGDPRVRGLASEAVGQLAEDEGRTDDAIEMWEQAAEHYAAAGSTSDLADIHRNVARVLHNTERYAEAVEAYRRSIALREEAGEPQSAADAWMGLGGALKALSRFDEALVAYQEARALYAGRSDLGAQRAEARALARMAEVLKAQGQLGRAMELTAASLEIRQRFGELDEVADGWQDMGSTLWDMGELSDAERYYAQALDVFQELGRDSDAASCLTNLGSLAWIRGDLDTAHANYEAALGIYRALGQRFDESDVLQRMGDLQGERGAFTAAYASLDEAIRIREALGMRGAVGETLLSLGQTLERQGNLPLAIDTYTRALGLFREVGDRAQEADALNRLAWAHFLDKDTAAATEQVRQALALQREIGDAEGAAQSLVTLANFTASFAGDLDQAEALADEALATARALPSKPREADALEALAGIYANRGQLQRAHDTFSEALALFEAIGDKGRQAQLLARMADVEQSWGQYEACVATYERVIGIAQEAGLPSVEANALLQIAWTKGLLGQPADGLVLAEKAEAMYREADDDWGLMNTYNTLGSLYGDLGELATALEYNERSMALAVAFGDRWGQVGSLNNIGTLYNAQRDFESAVDYFGRARAKAVEMDFLTLRVITGANHAEALGRLGRYDEAEAVVTAALAEAEDGESEPQVAALRITQGTLYAGQQRYDEALAALREAEAIAARLGLVSTRTKALTEQGQVLRERGDPAAAARALEQAIALVEQYRLPNASWRPRYELGLALRDAGRPDDAIASLKRAVTELEGLKGKLAGGDAAAARFEAGTADVYAALVDLLMAEGRAEEAWQYVGRGKAQEMSQLGGDDAAVADAATAALLEQAEALRSREVALAKQLEAELALPADQQSSEKIDHLLAELDTLQLAFEDFTASLAAEHPDVYDRIGIQPPDFYKLQGQLREGEALLEPVVLPDRVALFVVRAGNTPLIVREVEITEADLRAHVARARAALEFPRGDASRGARTLSAQKPAAPPDPVVEGKALYDLLIAPILADLEGVETLLVSPGGALRYVPFAALHDGEGWLIERYRLAVLTESGALGRRETLADQQQAALLAFANPDATLPGAEAEVAALSDAWGDTRTFVGDEATKAALRREVRTSQILHLATHGVLLSENPEGSYLLFAGEGADARLTFREITLLPLVDTRLAVLSACSTAMGVSGEGTEIIGLAHQFERRGADTVVASLWDVNDASTSALMTAFYTNLRDAELGRAEALRRAQLGLLADPATAHPYYWAPFILIGDWR
ncbi:MAG: CHAT domain-containing protein [Alphaproteobacteria bacterium]|nr:CHAT domain-containing protein [Alphaproteobacteria bacterium]